MHPDRLIKMGLALVMAAGTFHAGRARGDDGHSGNVRVPSYFVYPRGRAMAQVYATPAEGTGNLEAFVASPGAMHPSAPMSILSQQPSAKRLLQRPGLVYLPRTATRVRLTQNQSAVGPPSVLFKYAFGLQYNDVPLSRHTSQAVVLEAKGNERKALFTRMRNSPDPNALPDTQATNTRDAATAAALEDVKRAIPDIEVEVASGNEPMTPHLEIVVRKGEDGKSDLSWSFVVRARKRADRFARQYWIAAKGEPKVLLKEDLVYLACAADAGGPPTAEAQATTATSQGKVTGNIYGLRKSPLDPPTPNQPLQDYIVGSSGGVPILTDDQGEFVGATAPPRKALAGSFARIINEGGSALVPQHNGSNLFFNATTESELAQVSAFFWVNFAHEFVRPFLPTSPDLLLDMPVHVNLDQTCNAFFSGSDNSLNFFRSGGGCVNSAFCDVACHEFGHAVDAQFGDIQDGAYSEGFGDSVAILITHDSIIGRDFLGRGRPLRNAADPIQWPEVRDDFDPHVAGQPYAGFTWELTRQLLRKFNNDERRAFEVAKQLTLGAAALNPRDVPDAVRLTFFVDRRNGTDLFDAIAEAADSRQIPRPPNPSALDDPESLNLAD